MGDWKHNVGEFYLSDEAECFWIFPTQFFTISKLRVTSRWFSHVGETWRFAKESGYNENHITLYLWKKPRHSPPSHKYASELYFKTIDGQVYNTLHGNINTDFGCEWADIDYRQYCFSSCGLVKLYFVIRKIETIPGSLPSIEASSEDDNPELEEEPEKNAEDELKGVDRLLQNLKNLLHDDQSSDVLLKFEDREFKVHKAILKVRSPVFASMFQPHTKESATGVVDIPDCSASAFENFLIYIYTGNADAISSSNVVDLYYAADKYQINDLKSECVEFMETNLSVDNFCDVMTLSLQHNERGLQKTATRFFCDNVKKIIKTVQWQKYMKDYATEANELYIKAINA